MIGLNVSCHQPDRPVRRRTRHDTRRRSHDRRVRRRLSIYSAALVGNHLHYVPLSTFVEVFAPPSGDFSAIRAILSAFMMIGLTSYMVADAVIHCFRWRPCEAPGDTRWLMVASVSLHWAMLVAQFFIIRVFELSPKVSWMAFVAMILAIAAVYALRLKGGHWRDPEALERVMAE